jgi:hypothetical protein
MVDPKLKRKSIGPGLEVINWVLKVLRCGLYAVQYLEKSMPFPPIIVADAGNEGISEAVLGHHHLEVPSLKVTPPPAPSLKTGRIKGGASAEHKVVHR